MKKCRKSFEKVKVVFLAAVLCVCLWGCRAHDSRWDDIRYENDYNEMFEKILKALDEEDVDALKSLMSDNVIKDVENLDEWVDELMEFYEGKSLSYECSGGVEMGINPYFYEKEYAITTDKDVYYLSFGYTPRDPEFEKEYPGEVSGDVGINSILILKKELRDEVRVAQWANGEEEFSIYYTIDDIPAD